MVSQLYQKYTLPTNLMDARLSGEFANLYASLGTILPLPLTIANGGTNSSTALNNNRVMKSAGGAIVEAAAITASRALASDSNGIPVAATTTTTELNFVNGVTSAIQTQINGKEPTVTKGNLTDVGTDGITIGNGSSAVIGSGTTITQHVSDATHNGYLSSTDWSTFNGKQASGNYVTALTGDVTATGPGSVAATLATVNASPGATTISSVTTNGKGLVTANSSASTTGSGNVVLASSPTLVTPILGAATATSITFSPTTSGIVGTTTNDNAAAGKVGEVISASVVRSSAITVTSGSTLNIVSISLTAGDWDVRATITIEPAGTTAVTNFTPAISTTSVTLPGADTIGVPDSTGQIRMDVNYPTGYVPTSVISQGIPSTRVSISTTTTYYLVLRSNFSVSTETTYGSLVGRRVR